MHESVTSSQYDRWGATLPDDLVIQALTHRSWAYENQSDHNERLEFLGDSVLGMIVAEYIYTAFPDLPEGEMSKIKAASVSERALAEIARGLSIGKYVRLGKGEDQSGGREKASILSDTVEALIAATFLTHGMDVTREVVMKHLLPLITTASTMGPALDWRTAVEELAREKGITTELYYCMDNEGPDHAKVYTSTVFFDRVAWGRGSAPSQKAAKLVACEDAYARLKEGTPLADA